MAFQHVKQPNSYTCGPAVVAIVTGDPIERIIAELRPGAKRGTPHRRLIGALRARGVRCGDRFLSLQGKPLPHSGIIRITYQNKHGHVVVKHGRTWFDPLLDAPFTGEPIMTVSGRRIWVDGAHITSSLWLGDGMS